MSQEIRLKCLTPGTDSWLKTSIDFARKTLVSVNRDANHFYREAQELIQHEAWNLYFKDEPKTWERFLKEALDVRDVDDIINILCGVEAALAAGIEGEIPLNMAQAFADQATPANKPGNPSGNNQYQVKEERKPDNCKDSTKYGNDPEYLTSVIARDRPDILERMKSGEFKSVRAAAIEAGIVQDSGKMTISTQDPIKAAATIRRAMADGKIDMEYFDRLCSEVKAYG